MHSAATVRARARRMQVGGSLGAASALVIRKGFAAVQAIWLAKGSQVTAVAGFLLVGSICVQWVGARTRQHRRFPGPCARWITHLA